MERLSTDSLIKSVGASGMTGSDLTLRHGSTPSDGTMSVDPSAARARLLAQRPEETDRNLKTWLKSLGIDARQDVRLTYPAGGGYRREVTGYSFAGLTPENHEKAQQAVQAALTPATGGDCEAWITTMYAAMAHRAGSEETLSLLLSLYAGRLGMYPADVAKETCMWFALRREKPNWFPTLSELDEECEKRSQDRLALYGSL